MFSWEVPVPFCILREVGAVLGQPVEHPGKLLKFSLSVPVCAAGTGVITVARCFGC